MQADEKSAGNDFVHPKDGPEGVKPTDGANIRNRIERFSLRASQHQMTKPTGYGRWGKCGGCAPTVDGCAPSMVLPSGVPCTSRFFLEETVIFLFGEICPACGLWG